jgi:hypothetical protein
MMVLFSENETEFHQKLNQRKITREIMMSAGVLTQPVEGINAF